MPCSVKTRSIQSLVAPVPGRRSTTVRGARERAAELIETRACLGADGDGLGARDQLTCLLESELQRLRVDGVRLRHRDDAVLDRQQPQDRKVFERLRPGALAGVDDQQKQVDPARAGHHRAHEPLVPGHVDHGQAPAVGEVERRVPEVDRDSARLLLGQPVGVLARQGPDEPGLAMVDVPGGADRQRHERTAAATSPASASVSVRQSSNSLPSRTTPITGGSLARSGAASSSSTEQAKLGSSASGSAPPPTRPTVSSTLPPTAAASRSARFRTTLRRLTQHPQHGHLAQRPLGVEVQRERSLQRCDRELVRTQSALERVAAQTLDEVGAADDDPGLRPAQQLVAREADEIRARAEALARGRLAGQLDEHARAEVVDERDSVAPRRLRELGDGRLLGEADEAEVRLVHAQEHRGSRPDRALVVGDPGPVRRPHLDEPGARAGEHVRNPEAVPDLDQLAARDEHLAALGQRSEGEQHRGRVVVDDERGLGAGQPPQHVGQVMLA